MKTLIFLVLIFPLLVHASVGRFATFTLGAAGVVSTSYYGAHMEEIHGWKSDETESTSVLSDQCQFLWDFRLLGNNKYNYFIAVLKRQSSDEFFIDPLNIKIHFDNGIKRLAPISRGSEKIRVVPAQASSYFITFPSKNDFKDANEITVAIPLFNRTKGKKCVATAKFLRNKNRKVEEISYKSESTALFTFGYGKTFDQSTVFDQVGDGKDLYDLSFYGFRNLHHGMGMTLSVLPFGKGDMTLYAPLTGDATLQPDPHLLVWTFGYSYRHKIFSQWKMQYDIQLGWGSYSYEKKDESLRETESTFAMMEKISLYYTLFRKTEGLWQGDYHIGLSVNHYWLAAEKLGDIRAKGHIVGGTLFMGVGF